MAQDSQCNGCGHWDTHPKAHWNTGGSFHHDCLPAELRQELIETHPLGQKIIDAAEGGTRGEDLLNYIQELHADLAKKDK